MYVSIYRRWVGVSRLGEFFAHQSVEQVHRLERSHHHLEMRDSAIVIEGDDVDAVDRDAVDGLFEFEHRATVASPLPDISEPFAAQDLLGTRQIFEGDLAPALRGVHHGAFEHSVGMKQIPQRGGVMRLDVAVPFVERADGHRTPPWAKGAGSNRYAY